MSGEKRNVFEELLGPLKAPAVTSTADIKPFPRWLLLPGAAPGLSLFALVQSGKGPGGA